jgi:hypothetical protein
LQAPLEGAAHRFHLHTSCAALSIRNECEDNPGSTKREHYFDIPVLATRAVVGTLDVYRALRGDPISRAAATAILMTLSQQVGQKYTLENVAIALKEPAV